MRLIGFLSLYTLSRKYGKSETDKSKNQVRRELEKNYESTRGGFDGQTPKSKKTNRMIETVSCSVVTNAGDYGREG